LKILVTNDDGVQAHGLWSVVDELKEVGDVTVVAPDRDQSGIGTSRTLLQVLRAYEVPPKIEGIKTYAVHGTPADCVVLGVEKLVQGPIDLIVSGANEGSNLGLDVLVSGTAGGAFQGYFRSIPSIAVSVGSLTNVIYEAAAMTTRVLAECIAQHTLPAPYLLNVNLPNVAPQSIVSAEITRLGPRLYLESVTQGNDGRRTHYWIKHDRPSNAAIEDGTDIRAVRQNKIAITPVHFLSEWHTPPDEFQVLADAVNIGLGLRQPVDTHALD
jgi:5'-nucleotidase